MAVILCVAQTYGATWYVNKDATGANDGSTWADAFKVLTNALNALAAQNISDGFVGGHLILVTNASGSLATTAYIHEQHSGAHGNPNEIRSVGRMSN